MLNSAKESSTRTAVIAGLVDTLLSLGALIAAQSAVVLADFLKTLLEFVAVLLAWLAIRRIRRGAGATYDYGIGKLENLSSLAVAALMILVVLVIVANAVRNIVLPGHIGGAGVYLSLVLQVIYSGINGSLWKRAQRTVAEENSPIMAAQAKLFFTKLVGNVFIFISLAGSLALAGQAWSVYIDPVASLVIAGSILMSALRVLTTSCYDLLDGTLEEGDQLKITRELVAHFERYDMLYGVRSRRSGNRIFIDIFLGFDAGRRVGEVQREMEVIRKSVAAHFPNSVVTVIIGAQDAVPVPVAATHWASQAGRGDDPAVADVDLQEARPVEAGSASN
ncbi:MAG: cation diffusion facilitator family transporter [Betaproteobacteria bacterium]|nr:cation diffusion facilitator family transporter [Betaproteobacteria bacterium]